MTEDIRNLSVPEIRERIQNGSIVLSVKIKGLLLSDPRKGVQDLLRSLERRDDRERKVEARAKELLRIEQELWDSGIELIAGVDEAGMGPLAGPVVAGAVVFAKGFYIKGIDDSKTKTETQREHLYEEILRAAVSYGVGIVEAEEIDRIGIYQAGLLAMRRAVEALAVPVGHVLVDAREIPGITIPQSKYIKGDARSHSIAAASIIAKVTRDRIMVELASKYPEYGLEKHKGYGTKEHTDAIAKYGLCPIHRKSYAVLSEIIGETESLFGRLKEMAGSVGSKEDLEDLEGKIRAARSELTPAEYRRLRGTLKRLRDLGLKSSEKRLF